MAFFYSIESGYIYKHEVSHDVCFITHNFFSKYHHYHDRILKLFLMNIIFYFLLFLKLIHKINKKQLLRNVL